jgi:hypothetical protein
MLRPTLCSKHFYRVANYFDKRVALQFDIDGESCLVCDKTIDVEMARWFVQKDKKATARSTIQPTRDSRYQA